jgi:hypothetical protein
MDEDSISSHDASPLITDNCLLITFIQIDKEDEIVKSK